MPLLRSSAYTRLPVRGNVCAVLVLPDRGIATGTYISKMELFNALVVELVGSDGVHVPKAAKNLNKFR